MAGLLGALPQRRRSKSSRPSRTGMAAGALTRCADTLSISNMKSFEDFACAVHHSLDTGIQARSVRTCMFLDTFQSMCM